MWYTRFYRVREEFMRFYRFLINTPALTEKYIISTPGFRDFRIPKPARTGGTSLSAHVGVYPPRG